MAVSCRQQVNVMFIGRKRVKNIIIEYVIHNKRLFYQNMLQSLFNYLGHPTILTQLLNLLCLLGAQKSSKYHDWGVEKGIKEDDPYSLPIHKGKFPKLFVVC